MDLGISTRSRDPTRQDLARAARSKGISEGGIGYITTNVSYVFHIDTLYFSDQSKHQSNPLVRHIALTTLL